MLTLLLIFGFHLHVWLSVWPRFLGNKKRVLLKILLPLFVNVFFLTPVYQIGYLIVGLFSHFDQIHITYCFFVCVLLINKSVIYKLFFTLQKRNLLNTTYCCISLIACFCRHLSFSID